MNMTRLDVVGDLSQAMTLAGDSQGVIDRMKALGWSIVRTDALPLSWLDPGHGRAKVCPGCGEDLSVVGLPKIAYVHDGCQCGTPEYTHLVEQLWHRACLAAAPDADGR